MKNVGFVEGKELPGYDKGQAISNLFYIQVLDNSKLSSILKFLFIQVSKFFKINILKIFENICQVIQELARPFHYKIFPQLTLILPHWYCQLTLKKIMTVINFSCCCWTHKFRRSTLPFHMNKWLSYIVICCSLARCQEIRKSEFLLNIPFNITKLPKEQNWF